MMYTGCTDLLLEDFCKVTLEDLILEVLKNLVRYHIFVLDSSSFDVIF